MSREYYHRELEERFIATLKQFPALLVTGPRQAGKSTFLQHCLPDYHYVTLDSPAARAMAIDDPKLFFSVHKAPLVIDEIQYAPELLFYIKMRIDSDRDLCGQFVLTGSQVFQLMAGVSESLAGRIAIFHLYPFSWSEVEGVPGKEGSSRNDVQVADQIVQGFYPELLRRPEISHEIWHDGYFSTYLERDLRSLKAIKDLARFQTFVALLAARAGGLLNLSEVAKECGIAQPTAKDWLSMLEATYVIYLLRPYSKNHSKRAIKSPKLYFIDTGLLCFLLGIDNGTRLLKAAEGGKIFENMVIVEWVKRLSLVSRRINLYFYRTYGGTEVDLLVETGGELAAYEIKFSKTPVPRMAASVKSFVADHPGSLGYLLSLQEETQLIAEGVEARHWSSFK